jgi:hypothetical protein
MMHRVVNALSPGFPMVRHPTRLYSTRLLVCVASFCWLPVACLLLACCSSQPIRCAVLCCAVLCCAALRCAALCSLRRTDALLRVVPARCTAEPTQSGADANRCSYRCKCECKCTAEPLPGSRWCQQTSSMQPKQISAQRTPKGCGPGTLGKASGHYSQPRDSRLGSFGVSDPCGPLLDMPVVVVMLVAFSEHLLCRLVLV